MEILNAMINPQSRIKLKTYREKRYVILSETGTYSVKIYGLPHDTVVIKADDFPAPNKIFTSEKGLRKRADFIIFARSDKKKVIICIELKKDKGRTKDIIQQLNGAWCCAIYCQQMGQKFYSYRDFLKNYQYRFVSIGKVMINKAKTRMDRFDKGLHNKPENMLKIQYPRRLVFNHLARKC